MTAFPATYDPNPWLRPPVATTPQPVALVIPVKNQAGTIASRVQSELSQDKVVVIVDNGSTDGTADIARHAGALVIRRECGEDFSHTLQVGIRLATRLGSQVLVGQ